MVDISTKFITFRNGFLWQEPIASTQYNLGYISALLTNGFVLRLRLYCFATQSLLLKINRLLQQSQNYNKAELTDMIRYFTLCSSFFGCFYIGLHLLTPFVRKNEGELFAGILTAAYVLSLALSVFVLNSKFKSRIIQVDDNTNDLEK